jgi:hypothetical protein
VLAIALFVAPIPIKLAAGFLGARPRSARKENILLFRTVQDNSGCITTCLSARCA